MTSDSRYRDEVPFVQSRSADGNVHCDHGRSSGGNCPGPVVSEADMTCVSKQRPQIDVACHMPVSISRCTWCLRCENRRGFDVGMGRSGTVIGSGMVHVTPRNSQGVGTVQCFACVHISLVICFVKRTLTCVDDTPAAGVSCVRRMATWRCEDKQRGDVCISDATAPHMMLAWSLLDSGSTASRRVQACFGCLSIYLRSSK